MTLRREIGAIMLMVLAGVLGFGGHRVLYGEVTVTIDDDGTKTIHVMLPRGVSFSPSNACGVTMWRDAMDGAARL